jgi:Na+/H+ antiporter NhaA
LATDRLGVLVGTVVSAVWGYIALNMVLPRSPRGDADT